MPGLLSLLGGVALAVVGVVFVRFSTPIAKANATLLRKWWPGRLGERTARASTAREMRISGIWALVLGGIALVAWSLAALGVLS